MAESAIISIDQLLDDLEQLLRLPGVAGQTDDLTAVADGVAALMRRCGLEVQTVATPGPPVVIGRRPGREPWTLLLYHHYDVPPPGAWRSWHHEPFQLAEREGILYGRGVAAGKGPLVAHLNAIGSLVGSDGELPCGVVVVAEGEGLTGSPHLAAVVADARALLRADACLATGGERDAHDRPLCYNGVKGLLQARLRAGGANQALPTGLAASVPNPLWRLLWALGQIKSDEEEILIADFYDEVEGPNRAENQALRAVALDEAGRLASWGIPQFMFGMNGATLVRTEATLPTCNITALTIEPAGDFAVIPISATARIDFQLVPRQHPQAIIELLRTHLQAKGLDDITVERLPGGYPGAHASIDHPFIQQVSGAGRALYGAPLALLPQGPFTQPLHLFAEAFGIPVAAVGCARHDSATTAPNERLPLQDLVRHGQLLIELLYIRAQHLAAGTGGPV